MNAVFGDTSLFVGFLSARDALHAIAERYLSNRKIRIVTTQWVLVETGNFVCKRSARAAFAAFLRELDASPRITILPASDSSFQMARTLYEARSDKGWSFTDCISIAVMEQLGLRDVLTSDHHFEQAGYNILLR